MNVSEVVQYWAESADEDWPVVRHLMASGDYHYSAYNLETWYPEDRFRLRERYSKQFTSAEVDSIREVGLWLKTLLTEKQRPETPDETG